MKSLKLLYPPHYLGFDFFHQIICFFGITEHNKTHGNLIRHHYQAKFKMAAMKLLIVS